MSLRPSVLNPIFFFGEREREGEKKRKKRGINVIGTWQVIHEVDNSDARGMFLGWELICA